MANDNVMIVHLRRPRSKEDSRHDPFWEFGSFGITGCHSHNLLHFRNVEQLQGSRLAFAQGGSKGMRLVHLTPPINDVIKYADRVEVIWKQGGMPFRYGAAPILVSNGGKSDFPKLQRMLGNGNRTTIEAQFSSRFRSRTKPLEAALASELISLYDEMRKACLASSIAETYADALPVLLANIDGNRRQTYAAKRSLLDCPESDEDVRKICGPKREPRRVRRGRC